VLWNPKLNRWGALWAEQADPIGHHTGQPGGSETTASDPYHSKVDVNDLASNKTCEDPSGVGKLEQTSSLDD
jgi:hypothetical protein